MVYEYLYHQSPTSSREVIAWPSSYTTKKTYVDEQPASCHRLTSTIPISPALRAEASTATYHTIHLHRLCSRHTALDSWILAMMVRFTDSPSSFCCTVVVVIIITIIYLVQRNHLGWWHGCQRLLPPQPYVTNVDDESDSQRR